MLIQLLLSHHLKEDFHSTAYSINVYLLSGLQAMRLTRLSREAVEAGQGPRIDCTFLKKTGKKAGSASKDKTSKPRASRGSTTKSQPKSAGESLRSVNGKAKKRKKPPSSEEDDGSVEEIEEPGEFDDFIVDDEEPLSPQPKRRAKRLYAGLLLSDSPQLSGDEDNIWTFKLDDQPPPRKRSRRTSHKSRNLGPGTDDEVLILSD